MKIAIVTASQVPATTANSIQVMKVCQSFAQLGHETHLMLPGRQAISWTELADRYGLTTPFAIHWLATNPALRRYDLAWKAVQQARSLKVDLVYTRLLQGAFFSLQVQLPAMLELHDRITGRIGPQLFRLCRRSRTPKRWLPITLALQRALEHDFEVIFSPGEAVVLPDGVDLERYNALPEPAEARQQLGLPQKITAAYVGSFYAGRGMEMLFSLAQANPQVNFMWVGGKPVDVAYWRQRFAQSSMDNVKLTGFIANAHVPLYQAAAEILLMPYERATATSSGGNTVDFCSPLKMFEYMAAGRAIISSDLPVLHEALSPTSAIFCPPEDAPAWRQAFAALIADPGQRHALAVRARQDVAQYSWQARAQRSLDGFDLAS
jgi:glycosyltransferase involved in cell wall biosynthesis